MMNSLLDNAVIELSRLPGIGPKTALRLALHLLRRPENEVLNLSHAIADMRTGIRYCEKCHNISDSRICPICSDKQRLTDIICVVENIKDVMSIESTKEFNGLYHVLGGLIAPIEGIGPADLNIASLINRVKQEKISEVILALSPTLEGDTTNFYIYRKLNPLDVKITTLARGITIGNDIELTDELTLGRSIQNRIEFKI